MKRVMLVVGGKHAVGTYTRQLERVTHIDYNDANGTAESKTRIYKLATETSTDFDGIIYPKPHYAKHTALYNKLNKLLQKRGVQ